ncbi:2-isopropylmalate synthase [Thermosporothrix hazakensis]|uniref:2-isopropylmalate synthase n=1 Tax=Thermosporothrix hazakensis TaxID=644383 RepID=A0A326UUC3_THEHA|nr:2-isopropylmalate synthase [Thermosporothrix hazakensis]PZW36213.1 2-isopropylmalate synthase [Thermosporothrix hazakensis]GCE46863.1 hypothetical protein KTH_17320 [Thermosporothrix hazakensis]
MGNPAMVKIFDTTLRDGEQSPGATMTLAEKLLVAERLADLRVDILEAGFPAASLADFAAVKEIARRMQGKGVAVAALARANANDIELAWEALRDAEQPVIHIFMATSDQFQQRHLSLCREEALQRVRAMISYARRLCPTVEFSAEDATRTEREYLYRVLETAIRQGATTINLPDTVGYSSPEEYGALFRQVCKHVPGIEAVTLSAHCHDDLGLATANALAAIRAGARQVEVTINGIGERAGNTALEEVVMALRTRADAFGVDTRIRTEHLVSASQLVSRLTGLPVQPNKAIVGANAFAPDVTFMTPQSVGRAEVNGVLCKQAGRYGLDAHLRQLGYRLSAEQLKRVYRRFVTLADEKKIVTDDDLIYMVECSRETPVAI